MMAPPVIELRPISATEVEIELALQSEQECFAGHFEGWPVLAGVIQIDWVMLLARRHLGCDSRFRALQSTKFLRLIRPPLTPVLSISYQRERGLIRFSYRDGEVQLSNGVIRVDEVPL